MAKTNHNLLVDFFDDGGVGEADGDGDGDEDGQVLQMTREPEHKLAESGKMPQLQLLTTCSTQIPGRTFGSGRALTDGLLGSARQQMTEKSSVVTPQVTSPPAASSSNCVLFTGANSPPAPAPPQHSTLLSDVLIAHV